MDTRLCSIVNIRHPLIQAPMAGVSTPELAAAVSNAGALGSVSAGASTAEQAAAMIRQTRALTDAPFNVNVFCHAVAPRNPQQEQAWIARLAPLFTRYGAQPPAGLSEIYRSFTGNGDMLEVLLDAAPAAVSFHFGLPEAEAIRRLKARGIVTLASVTSVAEARAVEAAGVDILVAQGIEAGGHRGIFNPHGEDQQLSTFTLLQAILPHTRLPVVAAGGIMDGAGIAAMLRLGAAGAQLGTAFILCPESAAGQAYRQALKQAAGRGTMMTAAISGRPARCLSNEFCRQTQGIAADDIPAYPLTYSLGKALAGAAAAQGEHGFGAQWAGQGAALAREMPAGELVAALVAEWRATGA